MQPKMQVGWRTLSKTTSRSFSLLDSAKLQVRVSKNADNKALWRRKKKGGLRADRSRAGDTGKIRPRPLSRSTETIFP
eukprot:1909282-Rhodomonas_salina.1